jgi:murein DD-endopeptidase MepM/ murein hydrolase activator NlpD
MAHRGMAAGVRGRTIAYAAGIALSLAAPSAFAQEGTGGSAVPPSPASADRPTSAPTSSPPPPGIVVRPSPELQRWACVRRCNDRQTATPGATLRLRGRWLGRAYEVVFLGADGSADDVSAAPLARSRTRVDVRLPLGAVPGPMVVADRDGLESAPSAQPVAIALPATLRAAGGAPSVEVQAHARRAFFDARRAGAVSYVVHGEGPANVAIELVRRSDEAVLRRWDVGAVVPEQRQTLRWNGMVGRSVLRPGSYAFRATAVSASGARAESARAGDVTGPDPGAFQFLRHEFPVRGPHYFGEHGARFGGGRGHQGQDVFAACGTPVAAARGGKVEVKQYHARAGHYLVVDGHRTSMDYAYMHLRDAALVRIGQRVRTGQLLGYMGQTGRASGCHLHFEMWTGPGWYSGGSAVDPLPALLSWDRFS